MPRRSMPPPAQYDGDTHTHILDVAARLFALKGFKSVTLKEIALEVGIKIASLYYHYENKDALIEDVLARFREAHKQYNSWLHQANAQAESLEQVMDNLFNEHFLTSLDSVTRLGMSMTLKEQHNHKAAFLSALNYLYREGIQNIQDGFDRLIQKKIIPPSDTKTLATLFMFCVMSVNDIHLHEASETEIPIARPAVYRGLRTLLTSALSQGTLEMPGHLAG